MPVVFCLFTVSSAFALDPAVRMFVDEKVKVHGCTYGHETIAAALDEGLSRIAIINLQLVASVKRNAFRKALTIYCDVAPAPEAIFYDPGDDSIHLRRVNVAGSNAKANFFHEFLHFYGLDHIPDPRIVLETDDFIYDPVNACHLTAFPALATRLKLDAKIGRAAAAKCSATQPVNQDLRGFTY